MKRPREGEPWDSLNRLDKRWWILDENHVPKAVTVREWSEWYEAASKINDEPRRVASTETATMWVSTVFMGVDHNFSDKGPPTLFETMIFSQEEYPREFEGKIRWSREDFDTIRYATWDDAVTGHNTTVRRIEKLEADALAGIKSGKTPARGVAREVAGRLKPGGKK